jgi:hypothetical protein
MAHRTTSISKHHADASSSAPKQAAGDTSRRAFSFRDALRALGPGLITGAADDDPSGIGTYSQAGAQFG